MYQNFQSVGNSTVATEILLKHQEYNRKEVKITSFLQMLGYIETLATTSIFLQLNTPWKLKSHGMQQNLGTPILSKSSKYITVPLQNIRKLKQILLFVKVTDKSSIILWKMLRRKIVWICTSILTHI